MRLNKNDIGRTSTILQPDSLDHHIHQDLLPSVNEWKTDARLCDPRTVRRGNRSDLPAQSGLCVFWACTKIVGNLISHRNFDHIACARDLRTGRSASEHHPTSSKAMPDKSTASDRPVAPRSPVTLEHLFRPRMREPDGTQLDQLPNVYAARGSRILARSVSLPRA